MCIMKTYKSKAHRSDRDQCVYGVFIHICFHEVRGPCLGQCTGCRKAPVLSSANQ